MSEYTKGEWKISPDGLTIKAKIEYTPHYDAEPPQTLIAKCFQNGHLGRTERPTKEDLANAHLISAAPDLLKTCKILYVWADDSRHPCGCTCALHLALKKAKTIIIKAEKE